MLVVLNSMVIEWVVCGGGTYEAHLWFTVLKTFAGRCFLNGCINSARNKKSYTKLRNSFKGDHRGKAVYVVQQFNEVLEKVAMSKNDLVPMIETNTHFALNRL
jgi:hypothetical protein